MFGCIVAVVGVATVHWCMLLDCYYAGNKYTPRGFQSFRDFPYTSFCANAHPSFLFAQMGVLMSSYFSLNFPAIRCFCFSHAVKVSILTVLHSFPWCPSPANFIPPHLRREESVPQPGVLPAWRTLRKPLLIQNRPYGHPRSSPLRRRPPHSNSETTGPLAAAAAETTGNAGSDDINKTDPQQQLPRSKPQRRRNTKRPREHVPVASAGVDEKSKPRLIDGGQEGSVPWSGADPPPTSPFGEPTYSDRVKFSNIMDDVLGCEAEADLPSTLTQHVEFLLSVDVTRLTNDLIKWVVAALKILSTPEPRSFSHHGAACPLVFRPSLWSTVSAATTGLHQRQYSAVQ